MPESLTDSLERIVPDLLQKDEVTGMQTLNLHVERYEFACQHLRGAQILDSACGVGYGSKLIARKSNTQIDSIISIDNCPSAIKYAKQRYHDDKIHYILQDVYEFFHPSLFDTIISLETIEHLPDPVRFAQHLVNMLRPNGVLICSAPVTPSIDVNPHHQTDFTETSFRQLFIDLGLNEIASLHQMQPYRPFAILSKREKRAKHIRPRLIRHYLLNPKLAFKRIHALLQYGFTNHYLTCVWSKPTDEHSDCATQ